MRASSLFQYPCSNRRLYYLQGTLLLNPNTELDHWKGPQLNTTGLKSPSRCWTLRYCFSILFYLLSSFVYKYKRASEVGCQGDLNALSGCKQAGGLAAPAVSLNPRNLYARVVPS